MQVVFNHKVPDEALIFAVIVARYRNQWVFCKHKKRETYECPGGHREPGETIEETARRELFEETGAAEYCLKQIGSYGVAEAEKTTYGMLFYADIHTFARMPESEIEYIKLFDELPDKWTYPLIQPILLSHAAKQMDIKESLV